jgi:iron(III) transport system ATP-binding protein
MLTIENLVKTFQAEKVKAARSDDAETRKRLSRPVRAVDDISFSVTEGEMFTLLGPSGCGKTTTLRSIAGLERPDSGAIRVGDRVLFSGGPGRTRVYVPTNQRELGMVFQSYAIWPHMKVFDNVAFPLQVKPRAERLSRSEIKGRVQEILDLMELGDLSGRQATKLSGGQQQRLALARALVTEPALILLDEPLSNLDAKLRESLRFELKRFQRELGITSVYVTHDQVEALGLSSRIAVMREGKIMQIGRPRDIYEKPANQFVADFIGTSNFIDGSVAGREQDQMVVETALGQIRADVPDAALEGPVVLAVRPEGIVMSEEPTTGTRPNEWRATVVTRSYLGDSVDHLVRVGDQELRVRAHSNQSIPADSEITIHIDPGNLRVIPQGD